jgi:Bacterial regulatory proteins, luxR family
VLCLVADGLSNPEIARRMNVSGHTVDRHVTQMLRRSGARNRAGLVSAAFRAGVLIVDEYKLRPSGRRCLLALRRGSRATARADGHARPVAAAFPAPRGSRRGVIGGALAGAVGWALLPGSASASPRPGASKPAMTTADPADVRAALATTSGQRAVRTWGPVDAEAYRVSSDGRVNLMLTHKRDGVLTFIGISPDELRAGSPAAVSMAEVPGTKHAIRYFSVGGTPLADLTVADGRVIASAVPSGAVAPGRAAEVEPDLSPKQIACFVACIGRRAGSGCISSCISCVTGIALKHPNPVVCGECSVCAGSHGQECVVDCGL